MLGKIFDIKEMAVHDGPGLRTTVFFKGCPLRCRWCHNPEGLSSKVQLRYKETKCRHCGLCMQKCNHEDCKKVGRCIHICPENCLSIVGEEIETNKLVCELVKNADIMGNVFGGFTFSGGEPLAQPDFLFELLDRLKKYHLCIETSGYADEEIFKNAVKHLDMVIMDIKIADCELHKKHTGVGNKKILNNFEYLRSSNKPYIIRTPLIPNVTDTEENLGAIKCIIGDSIWEKLPYNNLAGAKYKMFGMEFPKSIEF